MKINTKPLNPYEQCLSIINGNINIVSKIIEIDFKTFTHKMDSGEEHNIIMIQTGTTLTKKISVYYNRKLLFSVNKKGLKIHDGAK